MTGKPNKRAFMPTRWGEPTKIVIENNYFGSNPAIYNFFELNCAVSNGSKFNGNTFSKEAAYHNFINFYDVESGTENKHTVIEIKNNTFDCGDNCNPFRIGCKGAPQYVDFYVEGNKYTADPATDPAWTGLFFIQPYAKETEDLGGISIYLKNNDIGNNKLFYYWAWDTDAQLITLDESKLPNIFVWDDVLKTYTRVSLLDDLDESIYNREVVPLLTPTEESNASAEPDTTGSGSNAGEE